MHVGKCVRPHVCAYNTFLHVCIHVVFGFFLAGGLACERLEEVMKIVVCVYRLDVFKLQFCIYNSYKGFDGKL